MLHEFKTIFLILLISVSIEEIIIDYKESTETINNPGCGFTTTSWIYCKPGETPTYSQRGNLILMFYDIGGFSSGANGITDENKNYIEGTDYELDETFFNSLRTNFENVRNVGGTIGVRFRYDSKGKSNSEPQTFEKVLNHMKQIKQSGILEEYKDILMFIESGFVGAWGEQHSGKYVSVDYKAKVLESVMNMSPEGIPVTVRTPDIIAKWLGIERKELDKYIFEKGSRESRAGMYNDGYLGSINDLGTFSNREIETNFMKNQMKYTYYGGEFSGNLDYALKWDTYKPENAIPEMYKTHLSYINSNIFKFYNNYTFSSDYDVDGVDNSAYYSQTVYKFIRDHIGYRFVIRNSNILEKVSQGGILEIELKIENTGFANPLKQMNTEIILEKDGNYMKTEIDVDPTDWYSCSTISVDLKLKIPGEIEEGNWNVYLKLSIGKYNLETYYMRSVKFANKDIWNGSLGANYIGNFIVIPSIESSFLSDYTFYQINTDKQISKSDGSLYTLNNLKIPDGRNTLYEWDDSSLILEEGENKLYAYNDNKYLYVMAYIKNDAENPVVNIKIKNKSTNKETWLYYMQNKSVYYNGNTYKDWLYSFEGNIYEFKVPMNELSLHEGSVITHIFVNIQDLAKNWASVGNIKSKEFVIKENFFVYSSYRTVSLKKDDKFTLRVDTTLDEEEAIYQWFFNNDIISGANKNEYVITKANSKNIGIYSVRIWTKNGQEKIIDICNIKSIF